MNFVSTSQISRAQKLNILKIWNSEYPENLCYNSFEEFEKYIDKLANGYHDIIIDDNGEVRGWLADFDRENERWFVMILDSNMQGIGYGSKLLDRAKNRHSTLKGWVIDKEDYTKRDSNLYQSPIQFYIKNSFKIDVEVRLELDILSAVLIKWSK